MTESECNATDIDSDKVIDCEWDASKNECKLIFPKTEDSVAGVPPECRASYESPL
jgi:hypothetical protein